MLANAVGAVINQILNGAIFNFRTEPCGSLFIELSGSAALPSKKQGINPQTLPNRNKWGLTKKLPASAPTACFNHWFLLRCRSVSTKSALPFNSPQDTSSTSISGQNPVEELRSEFEDLKQSSRPKGMNQSFCVKPNET